MGWYRMTGFSYSPKGLLSIAPLGTFLEKNFPVKSFEDLLIPFAAVACDLETGEEVVLKEAGDLALAIRASCTVPGVFAPVQYEGRTLIDGGVVALVPTEAVRELGAEIVIAVDVIACGATYGERLRPFSAYSFNRRCCFYELPEKVSIIALIPSSFRKSRIYDPMKSAEWTNSSKPVKKPRSKRLTKSKN